MNSSLFVIEIILIGIVISIQVGFFIKIISSIGSLKEIFPENSNGFLVQHYFIPSSIFKGEKPRDILRHFKDFQNPTENEGFVEVELLILNGSATEQEPDENSVMGNILSSINTYLIRNKGAATDFNLIKEIVERYSSSKQDEVSRSLNLPLFLGLMGTIIGIIFGLISLYLSKDILEEGISEFLAGVSIAMCSSFCGLLLTVVNTNFRFKNAEKILDYKKNDFYTFIQIELLPLINQNISSSVYDLHRTLTVFNEKFSHNILNLDKLFDRNFVALNSQAEILKSLENIDLVEFAKANVRILKELKLSMNQLEGFNIYLGSLSDTAGSLNGLASSFKQILAETNGFRDLGNKIDGRLEASNRIIDLMNRHLGAITGYSETIREVVVSVDDTIQQALEGLKVHTKNSIETIGSMEIGHEEQLRQMMDQLRSYFSIQILEMKEMMGSELEAFTKMIGTSKSALNNLEYLKNLDSEVQQIKLTNASNLEALKQSLLQTTVLLDAIKNKKLFSLKILKSQSRKSQLNGNSFPQL